MLITSLQWPDYLFGHYISFQGPVAFLKRHISTVDNDASAVTQFLKEATYRPRASAYPFSGSRKVCGRLIQLGFLCGTHFKVTKFDQCTEASWFTDGQAASDEGSTGSEAQILFGIMMVMRN
jgi:hypothetical protein